MPPCQTNGPAASTGKRSITMKLSKKLKSSTTGGVGKPSAGSGPAAGHSTSLLQDVRHFFRVVKAKKDEVHNKHIEHQHNQPQDGGCKHSEPADSHSMLAHQAQQQQASLHQQALSGCTFSAMTGLKSMEGYGGLSLSCTAGGSLDHHARGTAAGHHHLEGDDDEDYLDDADSQVWSRTSAGPSVPASLDKFAPKALPTRPSSVSQLQLGHYKQQQQQRHQPFPLSAGFESAGLASGAVAAGNNGPLPHQGLRNSTLSSFTYQCPSIHSAPRSGYSSLPIHLQQQPSQQATLARNSITPLIESGGCAQQQQGLPDQARHPLTSASPQPTSLQIAAAELSGTKLNSAVSAQLGGLLAGPAPSMPFFEIQPTTGSTLDIPDAEEGVCVPGLYLIPEYLSKQLPELCDPEE